MIPNDVVYLKCIECFSGLNLQIFKKDSAECIDGKLTCKKCKKTFPVIGGIPRILSDELMNVLVSNNYPEFFQKYKFKQIELTEKQEAKTSRKDHKLKKKTAETFGFEWLKYPKILKQFEKDWARYFNPYVKKEDIKGKVVADFGCGMAKHGYFIGKYKAKKYIGVDLSLAVEAAYRNTKQFKPLVVQSDIYAPPLNGEQIDLFYSIGVLHHLPYPEAGFLSITSLMKKKNSKILIWVYGRRNNSRALLLYNPIRAVTTRMPKILLYPLCHVPAVIVHGINGLQKGLSFTGLSGVAKKLPFHYYMDFPYFFKVSDSYDVFGTPKQVYYDMKDITNWFKHSKLKDYRLDHDVVQGIKGFGTK